MTMTLTDNVDNDDQNEDGAADGICTNDDYEGDHDYNDIGIGITD